jgi:SAM-dependent methyltransferase
MLRDILAARETSRIDIDSSMRIESHKAVLQRKVMLQELFREFHGLFIALDQQFFQNTRGLQIELGAGISPIRDDYSQVLATDVVEAPHLDRTLDAQAMDLQSNSVRALYGQFCFHHIPEPARFFEEVVRVVRPGGGVILIEPFFGPFASFVFKRLFSSEGFDKTMAGWNVPMTGPMSGANQALSYIVFDRDRTLFRRKYPLLEIVHQAPLTNYLRYLLSGGLNFRQLVPDRLFPVLKLLEGALQPARKILALHHVIVIRKGDA